MVNPTPNSPEPVNTTTSTSSTKPAIPEAIIRDEAVFPPDIMTDLIFENIGGQEIINIARNDIINGQRVSYSLISNQTAIEVQHSPKNIFSLPGTSESFFNSFAIKLDFRIPDSGTGPVIEETGKRKTIYLENNGDLVVNVTYMNNQENVEIQLLNAGTVLDDTIYLEES
jgi:hypothetical protein